MKYFWNVWLKVKFDVNLPLFGKLPYVLLCEQFGKIAINGFDFFLFCNRKKCTEGVADPP